MLPLSSANNWAADIIICGGGAYQAITSPTDPSCGRISPLAPNANWEMDSMPTGRGMVEGTLLPDGLDEVGHLDSRGFVPVVAHPRFHRVVVLSQMRVGNHRLRDLCRHSPIPFVRPGNGRPTHADGRPIGCGNGVN